MIEYVLSGIFVYPVKSLSGISVSSWKISETGLDLDRKWMIIDDHGQFMSQRTHAKMALIKVKISTSFIVLSALDREDLEIPINYIDGEPLSATIWNDDCVVTHVSRFADEWLSDRIEQNCRLVRQKDNHIRKVDQKYGAPKDQIAFSDGFPFLVISESSLNYLNNAVKMNLEMARFRPNLVVAGCQPFEEDTWREISIGEIEFRLPKPCSRCVIPTIDPETGKLGKEPLLTLNRLRRWQNKVYFGQNALHNQTGVLEVGSVIHVRKTGENQPPL